VPLLVPLSLPLPLPLSLSAPLLIKTQQAHTKTLSMQPGTLHTQITAST
jgi:hypothetical protein